VSGSPPTIEMIIWSKLCRNYYNYITSYFVLSSRTNNSALKLFCFLMTLELDETVCRVSLMD